jgi:hypothetical protein
MPSVKQTSQQGNEYNRVEQGFTEWSRKTSAIDSYKQLERFKSISWTCLKNFLAHK